MATNSNRFPLQSAIKKILDDPNSRPALPALGEGSIVGDGNFGKGDRYDTGKWSDIALNNGNVVVEVHNTTDSKSLYYHVGKVNGGKIDWDESHYYDKGVRPSVAINNNGLVVEVHKSQSHNTFWHRLGQVEGGTIKWRNNDKSTEYGAGLEPSVAITDDELVVEVHQSIIHDKGSGQLYYHVGRVKGDTIDWGKSHYYDNGVQPSVAITNDGLVVEVHKSENFDTLYYHIGRVKGDNTIDWGKSHKYNDGVHPSVAITNDGLVVEVHQSQSHNTLWYRGTGQVNNNTIDGWDDKKKSQNYGDGTTPRVACNGRLAVETHSGADNQLLSSVLTLPAFRGKWILLEGDNSYCYCACNSATDNKHRHASNHTMNIKAGAPYFYAVLTKDDDSIDFPTGAILTIQGPDGTNYNRDIQEENQLVIMSGSSVRCLIVKDPKPGDWKMTMTVPEGVGFHCECNTVPSKDVYDTMTETLDNSLQKRSLGLSISGFIGTGAIFCFLFPEIGVPAWLTWNAIKLATTYLVVAVGATYTVVNGVKKILSSIQLEQKAKGIIKKVHSNKKGAGKKVNAKILEEISSTTSKKKNKEEKPGVLLTWNMQGANWNDIANSPWYKIKDWFIGYSQREGVIPYNILVACLQECGSPPPSLEPDERNVDGIQGLDLYFWAMPERADLFLYILYHQWDINSNRVNLAIVSTTAVAPRLFIQGFLRPLIGIQNWDNYFFSIHAASGNSQGGDASPLLGQVQQQVNDPWWVAGDYNQEPQLLTQRLQANNVDVTVCPPNAITRPASQRMLDYAVRDANANEIVGEVPSFGAGLSDHLPVVYRL